MFHCVRTVSVYDVPSPPPVRSPCAFLTPLRPVGEPSGFRRRRSRNLLCNSPRASDVFRENMKERRRHVCAGDFRTETADAEQGRNEILSSNSLFGTTRKIFLCFALVALLLGAGSRDAFALGFLSDANPIGSPLNAGELLKFGFAGGVCCGVTHGAIVPLDVVKTRRQAEPERFSGGWKETASKLVAENGPSVLLTGLVPTIVGYSLQGSCKFGGVEALKRLLYSWWGVEWASQHRLLVVLVASACAELCADVLLCPFEAARIRMVSEAEAEGIMGGKGKEGENEERKGAKRSGRQSRTTSLPEAFLSIVNEAGVAGLWGGLGTLVLRQVPYTMAKFAGQDTLQQAFYQQFDFLVPPNLAVSVLSGVLGGALAACVSQPADVFLSRDLSRTFEERREKKTAQVIFEEAGPKGFFIGLQERLGMVAVISVEQHQTAPPLFIREGVLDDITNVPNLTTLDLGGNPIKKIEDLEPLTALKKLDLLSLERCPLEENQTYGDLPQGRFRSSAVSEGRRRTGLGGQLAREIRYRLAVPQRSQLDKRAPKRRRPHPFQQPE
eukprot:Cvel_27173.t1-p1 / transcript=Cvel_27173.t1 / gene=Cvel_27173 / organism=Chromera_velia_CCMP2878 / gene_product=Mitochondrial substrate carrier family protein N, putative / transcript_product=Mitochondrial substrate carrier family protein N, putative / location=Cvel_scaffold3348:6506-16707(+) / protein_length=554 / sequence_SO=supercontig / SO=protein_coding / is_pseudo=false